MTEERMETYEHDREVEGSTNTDLHACSRRDVLKAAAALSALSMSPTAMAQSLPTTILQSVLGAPGDRVNDAGRQVLLERILNHQFKYVQHEGQISSATQNGNHVTIVCAADHHLRDYDMVEVEIDGSTYGSTDIRVDADPATFHMQNITIPGLPKGAGTWRTSQNEVRLIGREGAVVSATNETPIVIASPRHGLQTGDLIVVGGVRGNTGANNDTSGNPAYWRVTRINQDSFSLDTSGGTGTHVANTGVWTDYTPAKVFDTAKNHQQWLFSEGNYNGTGLKPFTNKSNEAATRAHIDYGWRHEGRPIQNEQARKMVSQSIAGSNDGTLNVYQLGSSIGDAYNFDDLYGLVKLKLLWTCQHCSTDSMVEFLYFLLDTTHFKEPEFKGRTLEDLWDDGEGTAGRTKYMNVLGSVETVQVLDTSQNTVVVPVRDVIIKLLSKPAKWKTITDALEKGGVDPLLLKAALLESFEGGGTVSGHGDY